MSLKNWINRPDQETLAASFILGDSEQVAYVRRSTTAQDETTGFSQEVAPQVDYFRVKIRLDRPRRAIDTHDYVGLTSETSIRKNDLIMFTPDESSQERLRVVAVTKDLNGFLALELKNEGK